MESTERIPLAPGSSSSVGIGASEEPTPTRWGWIGLHSVAIAGWVASLFVRAVEPAVVGVWTGIDDLVNVARLAGAWVTQLYAVGGCLWLATVAARSRADGTSGWRRSLARGVVTMVVLGVLVASGGMALLARAFVGWRLVTRLQLEAGIVMGAVTAGYAAWIGRRCVRERAVRGAGLVALGAALVGVSRALLVGLQGLTPVDERGRWESVARVVASLEWVALALTAVWALAWLGTARSPRLLDSDLRRRLRNLVCVGLAVGIASVLTHMAVEGQRLDAGATDVFVARIADRLLDPLAPIVPGALRVYVECLRWTVALLALVAVPRGRPWSVGVALCLLGCGEVTSPAGALALLLGAWCLALAPAPDDRRRGLAPGPAAD